MRVGLLSSDKNRLLKLKWYFLIRTTTIESKILKKWLRQLRFYHWASRLLWALISALVQRQRRKVEPVSSSPRLRMRDPTEQQSSCAACCQPFAAEFQRAKLSLDHEQPAEFCRSQWQRDERCILWLVYRWLMAAFFGAGVLGSMVQTFTGGHWFIYLTDWGFTLCWYVFTYGAVVATIYYCKSGYFAPNSWALKVYWVSHFTCSVVALVITLVFWTALYPAMPEMGADLYNLWAHAFNSICMILDCFLVAFPTRLMHFVYPLVMGLVYGLFSLIYYLAGGQDVFGNRFIYFILDWSSPGLAIGTVCGCIVLLFLFCILVYWIYRLRSHMYDRWAASKGSVIVLETA